MSEENKPIVENEPVIDNKPLTRNQILKKFKKKTQLQEMTSRFFRNRLGVVGLVMFVFILFMVIFADFFADYQSKVIAMDARNRLQAPCAEYIFGTDEMGRDVFARLIHGGRISLSMAFMATIVALLIGGTLGAISGYFGGKLDELLMRLMDIMLSLPEILLAIAIVSALGTAKSNLILAIGISRVARFARIVRSSVLTVRGMEYVEAARAIGAGDHVIIVQHVLLNCLAPIIVQSTIIFGTAIMSISGLSFLGLGVQPPAPEWGNMLSASRNYMRANANLVLAPGLAIFFTIFSLNMLGDGIRDAMDPRLKQ